jgi:DNA-binding winged helix-turn-helix (wHTH) protein/Flp pilus assembly protein TadD
MQEPVAIGRFRLDFRTRLLTCDAEVVPLGPKVIETLMVLVSRPGELVTKAELMEALWPDRFVEEANLSQNVYRLRRAMAAGGIRDAIETLPGRGYRFRASVRTCAGQEDVRDLRTAIRRAFRVVTALAGAAAFVLAIVPQANALDRLSPASRQAYRLGLYHLNLRSDVTHARRALHYFQDVVAHDPRSALGYAGVADADLSIFDWECDSSVRRCPSLARSALQNAQRAVRLDGRSAEAHTALAMSINEFRTDDRAAEREFETAIALDPSYALAHHWYGNLLTVQGRYDEATHQHLVAVSLEPASPATYSWLAEDAFLSRRYAQAISYAQQAETLSPLRHPTLVLLGLAYERLGKFADARRCFARLAPIEERALTAALIARQGQRDRAAGMLRDISPARAVAEGASAAAAFAWMAVGDDARAYAYIRETPLPNRIERNFLARDPRWNWDGVNPRDRHWITPV